MWKFLRWKEIDMIILSYMYGGIVSFHQALSTCLARLQCLRTFYEETTHSNRTKQNEDFKTLLSDYGSWYLGCNFCGRT